MPDQPEISSTSQDFLEILDITRNVVVLKDGTTSLVMKISAMNFGLLAEQEQDAIIYAYASLLNSLNFPIQIIIRSKTKDATSYLALLEKQANTASSEEKKALIQRYKLFVSQLIKERNVLDKKFYVIIPATPLEVGVLTPETLLPGKEKPTITEDQKAAVIDKALGILEPRRDHLIAQFNRIGLYASQLPTQEIIEIFYTSYNPEAAEGQQISETSNYTSTMVKASTNLPKTPPVVVPTSPKPATPPEATIPTPPEEIAPVAKQPSPPAPAEELQPPKPASPTEKAETPVVQAKKPSAPAKLPSEPAPTTPLAPPTETSNLTPPPTSENSLPPVAEL